MLMLCPQIRCRFVLLVAASICPFWSEVAPSLRAAVIVTGINSNGETVDLTTSSYGDFVHFTANATNEITSTLATLGPSGIPNIAVTSGAAFQNFFNTYSNGEGEISIPNNPFAVTVVHGGGTPASNRRLWFGGWGTHDAAGFDLVLPSANGALEVFAGGFAADGSGGGTLTAVSSGGSGSSNILRSGNGAAQANGPVSLASVGQMKHPAVCYR